MNDLKWAPVDSAPRDGTCFIGGYRKPPFCSIQFVKFCHRKKHFINLNNEDFPIKWWLRGSSIPDLPLEREKKLLIEPGKYYKTREGKKVYFHSKMIKEDVRYIWIAEDEKGGMLTYTNEGAYNVDHINHRNDIVSAWIEKDEK